MPSDWSSLRKMSKRPQSSSSPYNLFGCHCCPCAHDWAHQKPQTHSFPHFSKRLSVSSAFNNGMCVLFWLGWRSHDPLQTCTKNLLKECGWEGWPKKMNEKQRDAHSTLTSPLPCHNAFPTCCRHKIYEPLFSIRAIHQKPLRQSQGDEGSGSAHFDPWSLNWHDFVVHVLNGPEWRRGTSRVKTSG